MKIDLGKFLDITAPEDVEIEIRDDGGVVWVHINGITVFRVCRMKKLRITDHRNDELMEQCAANINPDKQSPFVIQCKNDAEEGSDYCEEHADWDDE